MSWVRRTGSKADFTTENLRTRVLDGLSPAQLSPRTLIYDGFVPYWSIAWYSRRGDPATWARRV